MKITLESAEKFKVTVGQSFVIFAEGIKPFGFLPGKNPVQTLIEKTLNEQSRKILTDSVEIISLENTQVLVIQIPAKKGLAREDRVRIASARAYDCLKSRSISKATFCLQNAKDLDFSCVTEGLHFAAYEFNKYKSEKKLSKVEEINFIVAGKALKTSQALLKETEIIHTSITDCRDLVNEPGSHLLPHQFVAVAQKIAKSAGLEIIIRDGKALLKEGFTGLWTVGKGSDYPPYMVTISYRPTKSKKVPHLCFVGKGITFDTGGISLKPSAGMAEMKSDMAGAATALNAIAAIAQLKLPIQVTTVLCLAENRPGNQAVLPGDIFTAKNGKTIMVDNTDAEGRLVLTDGLAEAGLNGATHIIDLATLTGAIIRAIGPSIAGLFSNDAKFAQAIQKSGAKVSEKLWELPLEAEYREYLEDPVADMKNVGKSEAGAITAALFLEEFVPAKTAWAHLDIAGTAFTMSNWKYYKAGATGWGLKTLVEVARHLAHTA